MGLKSWLITLGAKDEPESLQKFLGMLNTQWEEQLKSMPNGRVPIVGVVLPSSSYIYSDPNISHLGQA